MKVKTGDILFRIYDTIYPVGPVIVGRSGESGFDLKNQGWSYSVDLKAYVFRGKPVSILTPASNLVKLLYAGLSKASETGR